MGVFCFVTAVLEFIMRFVCCYFDGFCINIVIYYFYNSTGKPEEDIMVDVWVAFGWTVSRLLDGDRGAKSSQMFEICFLTSLCFIWCLHGTLMICLVEDTLYVH